jgi:hypothetical protein
VVISSIREITLGSIYTVHLNASTNGTVLNACSSLQNGATDGCAAVDCQYSSLMSTLANDAGRQSKPVKIAVTGENSHLCKGHAVITVTRRCSKTRGHPGQPTVPGTMLHKHVYNCVWYLGILLL